MLDSKQHANNWTFSSKQPVRGELLIIPFHPREVTGEAEQRLSCMLLLAGCVSGVGGSSRSHSLF